MKPSGEDVASIAVEYPTLIRAALFEGGVQTADVDDVTQEVLTAAARSFSRFKLTTTGAPGELGAWVLGICRRHVWSYHRRIARRAEVLAGDELDEIAAATNLEEELSRRRLVALVRKNVERLEPVRRAVLVAYDLDEQSIADIAAATGTSENTLWTRLRLARNDLAGLLKRAHVSSREPARPARRKPAGARRHQGADHVRDVAP